MPRSTIGSATLVRLLVACAVLSANSSYGSCNGKASVVSHDRVRLSAECNGPEGSPALMLIHGWSQASVVWGQSVDTLSAGHRVVTYDVRGHGASEKPSRDAAYDGRWVHARDVAAVLEHYDIDRVVLVGWSFGAIVASDAAVYLGCEHVAGLILVSGTIGAGDARTRTYFGPVMQATSAMTEGPPGEAEVEAVRRFLRESYVEGSWDPTVYEQVLAVNLLLSPQDRIRVARRPVYDNADALNTAGIPVLLIHGSEDAVLDSEASVAAAARLDHATLSIYDGVGHWPFLEAAERFQRDVGRFTASAAGGDGSPARSCAPAVPGSHR